MSEYIVKGAEPNETVLHTRTPNGYEEWRWLPVREEIVRCKDCRFCGKGTWGVEAFPVCRRGIHVFQVSNDGFCKWGDRRDA